MRICVEFDVEEDIMFSKSRKPDAVDARHSFIILLKRKYKLTHKEVGECVGLDHSSISAALKRISNLSETDKEFREKLTSLNLTYGHC